MRLTADLRAEIKAARDRQARARVERERRIQPDTGGFCRGCGQAFDCWTPGCRACQARHYAKVRTGRHPLGRAWYEAQVAQHQYENGQLAGQANRRQLGPAR